MAWAELHAPEFRLHRMARMLRKTLRALLGEKGWRDHSSLTEGGRGAGAALCRVIPVVRDRQSYVAPSGGDPVNIE